MAVIVHVLSWRKSVGPANPGGLVAMGTPYSNEVRIQSSTSCEATLTGLALQYPISSAIQAVYGGIHDTFEREPSTPL